MGVALSVKPLRLACVDYLEGRIDVFAFLIQTSAGPVLVDTGVGSGNDYIAKKYNPEHFSVERALDAEGVALDDVRYLINSHLHFDHCGNNRLFPNARIYVTAAELAAAREPRYTVREWFDYPCATFEVVVGSAEVVPGVTLIPTPGHTPGHQSVLVNTEGGAVLIAAQAAFTLAEFQRGGDPAEQAHAGLGDRYQESIAQLQRLNAARILFSHDLVRPS